MDLAEVLATLDPDQRRAVELVYLEGRSRGEVAAILATEPAAVGTALAAAFRCIARWVMGDNLGGELQTTNFPEIVVRARGRHAAR